MGPLDVSIDLVVGFLEIGSGYHLEAEEVEGGVLGDLGFEGPEAEAVLGGETVGDVELKVLVDLKAEELGVVEEAGDMVQGDQGGQGEVFQGVDEDGDAVVPAAFLGWADTWVFSGFFSSYGQLFDKVRGLALIHT